jgi:hypothetical protein
MELVGAAANCAVDAGIPECYNRKVILLVR